MWGCTRQQQFGSLTFASGTAQVKTIWVEEAQEGQDTSGDTRTGTQIKEALEHCA